MFDPRNPYPGMQYGAFPGGMGMMRPPFNPYAQPQGPQPSVQPPVMQPPDETPVQEAMPWVRVPDVPDIFRVSVNPGQTVWVMCQNKPVFGVRSADKKGKADTELFRFEEFDPDAEQLANQPPQVDVTQFVTRAEFNELVRRLKGAEQQNESSV